MDTRRSLRLKEKAVLPSFSTVAPQYGGSEPTSTRQRNPSVRGRRAVTHQASRTTRRSQVTSNDKENAMVPARKRQRVEKEDDMASKPIKKFRGMRGKLSGLIDCPLDILFEILGFLEPQDILRLARSTKGLRAILMQRSTITVWQRAVANVNGLPPCPDWMSEPAYASLAFDSYCHYCFKTNVNTILWEAAVRCCNKCTQKRFLDIRSLREKSSTSMCPPLLYNFLPKANDKISVGTWSYDVKAYFVPLAERWHREYSKLRNAEAREAWLSDTLEQSAKVCTHAELCRTWHSKRTQDRLVDMDVARILRRDAIYKKLRDLGWSDEVELFNKRHMYSTDSAVWQAKPLTERVWRNIQPGLITTMGVIRAERLEALRKARRTKRQQLLHGILRDYMISQGAPAAEPTLPDLCLFPPFRDVLENRPFEDTKQPEGPEIFDEVQQIMPTFVSTWKDQANTQLVRLMQESLDLDDEDITMEHLNLATTFFFHPRKRIPIGYPRILMLSTARRQPKEASTNDLLYKDCGGWGPWNVENIITYHDGAAHVARELVELCGMDPDTATTLDVDALDPIYECKACACEKGRLVMTWKQAVDHAFRRVHSVIAPQWRLLDGFKHRSAKAKLMEAYDEWRLSEQCPGFRCAHCHVLPKTGSLKDHVEKVHKKVATRLDYASNPSVNPWPHRPVYLQLVV